MGTTGAQYMSYDRYGKTSHKEGFGSSFIVAGSALKTNDLGGIANSRLDPFGADLHDFMKRAKRGLTRIISAPPPARQREGSRNLDGAPSACDAHRPGASRRHRPAIA
jgi:hypothetical protein